MASWRIFLPLVLLASCAATPLETATSELGDAEAAARGLAYAQTACAMCHAVTAADPNSPNPDAPPFLVIANSPGMTPTALNAWLHSSHPSMPNLIVESDDRSDLAAYLNSLKLGRGGG